MILLDFFKRDKLARFSRAVREEGLRGALARTRQYVSARLAGRGITSVIRRRGSPGHRPPSEHLSAVWLDLAERDGFHISQPPAILSRRRKVAMIGDLNLPQCRKYRVEQLDEIWRLADVDYSFSHYEDVARSTAILQDATHVMFYRLCTTPVTSMLSYEARRLRLPILYDLDDPLFSVSAYGTYENMKALPTWQKKHFMNEAPKYLDVMNSADMLSVSTPGMKAHAELYSTRPIHVRRNFADSQALQAGARAMKSLPKVRNEGFRVAFASGSQGHEIDFNLIVDDVTAFLAGGADRKLVILGHFNLKLLPEGLRGQVETHPFSDYETYLEKLASVDCAVMPLTDDIFNRCKSAVRVIDAASVGVPSIVGSVSDMAEVVDDGQTGHVIASGGSWAEALDKMATDQTRTKEMGRQARQLLESRWSARLDAPVVDPEIIRWVQE
ncbi:MAG: glycosyltransferase [Shimia sp.]|jgi:glycosyltransferase involved in cell wall biosynthesis|uniref:glycosyltransferase n=1 Tax=Shimia sp. TaxID=1954381 RepID=UPI0040594261